MLAEIHSPKGCHQTRVWGLQKRHLNDEQGDGCEVLRTPKKRSKSVTTSSVIGKSLCSVELMAGHTLRLALVPVQFKSKSKVDEFEKVQMGNDRLQRR